MTAPSSTPEQEAAASRENAQALLRLARRAIEAHVQGEPFDVAAGPPSSGVFVTLWKPGLKLRGCVGRMRPMLPDLHSEVTSCAVAAASRDPRFPPVEAWELDELTVELSLLGEEEAVETVEALDPTVYGVVVRAGPRTGVLLPGVEGVKTAEEQVRIALSKAAIGEHEDYAMWRFPVDKVKPPASSDLPS